MMPVATVMPDDTPMFDPSILHELDWSENTTTFSPAISPLEPGDGLVMRPLCTADVNRGRILFHDHHRQELGAALDNIYSPFSLSRSAVPVLHDLGYLFLFVRSWSTWHHG